MTEQKMVPLIDSVVQDPVIATGTAQILTINGRNFAADATVTLRNAKEPGALEDVSIRELAATQIVVKSRFGNKPGKWIVEVHNAGGSSSGPYIFTVHAPAALYAPLPDHAAMPAPSTVLSAGGNKQTTQISTQQQAENEFRRAYQLMRQGHNAEALAGYEAPLALDPGHDLARQTMVSLLLQNKRIADAERVLQEGLEHNPRQSSFAMLLARLQVEHNALPQALDTLLKALPYAEGQPDYQAFVAALLQRQSRHAEAIEQYQKALQLEPRSGVWLMGLGISLRAEQRNADARDAFKRALDSNTLNAELHAYVTQQIKEL
ncbi:MAG TPA: tetratricopeptide repeat protein [Candidatus Paceibacterota bacterium]